MWRVLAVLVGVCVWAAAAHADIGKIGSPVVPMGKNAVARPAPAPTKPQAKTVEPDTAADKNSTPALPVPLVVFTFDKRHVYLDKALRQRLTPLEAQQAGVAYRVVSVVPSATNRPQNQRMNADAEERLAAVLQAMNDLGIGNARIEISSESSNTAPAPEIRIFVK